MSQRYSQFVQRLRERVLSAPGDTDRAVRARIEAYAGTLAASADAAAASVPDALAFLEKLTLEPELVSAADVASLRSLSISDEAIEDAVHVCVVFNILDRVADALDFAVPDRAASDRSAITLLRRGYAM
jgi:alkylhydroperoxidase family enzyme